MKKIRIEDIIEEVFNGKDFHWNEPFETKEIKIYTKGFAKEFSYQSTRHFNMKLKIHHSKEFMHYLNIFWTKIIPEGEKISGDLGLYLSRSPHEPEYCIRKITKKGNLGVGGLNPYGFDLDFSYDESKKLVHLLFNLYLDAHKKCCKFRTKKLNV